MKDIIDKINEQRRISRSIIKYWNVNYDPTPFGQEPQANQEADEMDSIEGNIKEDLQETDTFAAEQFEDEDQLTQERIDQILSEKTERIESLISEQRRQRGFGH